MIELPIETARLLVRRHQPQDREAFVSLVIDPRFHRYLTIPDAQRSADGAREVFDAVVSSYATDEPICGLSLTDHETRSFVGTVALHPAPFDDALELFYGIVPARWGEGLATEAVRAVLERVTHHDVVALTAPENERSRGVALAAGMEDAGLHQPIGGPARQRFVRRARID